MMRHVACPNCNTQVEWNVENQSRPFCSERCKLLDLGAWFLEERSIPEQDKHPEQFEPSLAKHHNLKK